MLRDTLYTVIAYDYSEGKVNASLQLNKDHELFAGHFPDRPVLPGACMLQMVKELLEMNFDTAFRLKKADQIKFLAMVDPGVNSGLQLALSHTPAGDNTLNVTALMTNGPEVCFKFKGSFINLTPLSA